ncbi:MAG: hypothetical protein QOF12_2088 [Solirubrobacteraceae bacterium]|nr:hypothetical protein [Solirubrobacteraceae bacterium]
MGCRILIADDVGDMRYLWRMILHEDPSLEVIGEASDGSEALAAVEALRPDVLLLDLAMPGVDGLQVLRSMRAQHPQTRVVVASAFAAGRFEALVTELGAAAYFEKGNSGAELRAMVRTACYGDQARAS